MGPNAVLPWGTIPVEGLPCLARRVPRQRSSLQGWHLEERPGHCLACLHPGAAGW